MPVAVVKLLGYLCIVFALAFGLRGAIRKSGIRFFQNFYLLSLLILGAFLFIQGASSEPVFSLKIIFPSFSMAVLLYFWCFKGYVHAKFIFSLFTFFTFYAIGFYFFQGWERIVTVGFLLMACLIWNFEKLALIVSVFFIATYLYALTQVYRFTLFVVPMSFAGRPFGFSLFVLYLFFGLFLFAGKIHKKQILQRFPGLLVSCFAFFHVLLVYYGYLLGTSANRNEMPLLHQKEILPVFLMSKHSHQIPWQTPQFALEDCTGNYVLVTLRGFGTKSSFGFLSLNQTTGKIQTFKGERTGESYYLDCPQNVFYFTSFFTKRVFAFRLPHITEPWRTYAFTAGESPAFVVLDKQKKHLLIGDERHILHLFDWMDGNLVDEIQLSGGQGSQSLQKLNGERIPDKQIKMFFHNRQLYLQDPDMYRYYYKNRLPGELLSRFAKIDYDPRRKRFYATSLMKGEFRVIDAVSEQTLKTIFLERLIRYLKAVPTYGLVFVSGHATGKLFVMDAETGNLLDILYTGPQVHKMVLSQDGKRLYFASNQGVFYINLPRLAVRLSKKKI